jgi:hypothetical protein
MDRKNNVATVSVDGGRVKMEFRDGWRVGYWANVCLNSRTRARVGGHPRQAVELVGAKFLL